MTEYFFYAFLILGAHMFLKYHPILRSTRLLVFIIGALLIILLSVAVSIILNLDSALVKIVTIFVAVAFQNKLSQKAEKT